MAADTTVLTMHQPWASLLVYGLKRIEGRTWDSTHRGRLWIHAAAKEMDPADLAELQAFYTQVHALDGNTPQFPPAYPTSALLGCVDVVDVLPQAAVEQWPGLPDSCRMEATSAYCFLCENPKRLVVPQPLKGEHKLWQLPKAVLKVALQGLRDPPGLPPFTWRAYGDPRAMLSPAPSSRPATDGRDKEVASKTGAAAAAKATGGNGERPGSSGRPQAAAAAGALSLAAAAETPQTAEALEKRVRAARKKLRQVAELQVAQAAGGAGGSQDGLTGEQLEKLAKAATWEAELAELERQLAAVAVGAEQ